MRKSVGRSQHRHAASPYKKLTAKGKSSLGRRRPSARPPAHPQHPHSDQDTTDPAARTPPEPQALDLVGDKTNPHEGDCAEHPSALGKGHSPDKDTRATPWLGAGPDTGLGGRFPDSEKAGTRHQHGHPHCPGHILVLCSCQMWTLSQHIAI